MLNFFKRLFSKNEVSETEESTLSNMKYLIVGLGNIGYQYENTRHNIGFKAVEVLAKKFDAPFKPDTHGEIAQFKHKGRIFILLKPSTYMNLSGKAVRYWMQKEKIQPTNLLVVVDELNLPFKKMRIRPKGSDGGHNGLKNIDLLLGNNNYPRLRMGIGDNFSKGKQVNYVLGEWSEGEKAELPNFLEAAADAALNFGTIGLELTMTQFNK